MMKLAVGREDLDKDICSSATMCRFENSVTEDELQAIQELFVTMFILSCYMPLMVFEGYSGRLILPLLKPGRRNKTANVFDTLQWLIEAIRAAWPKVTITVRGDSHFCSHELMDWVTGTLQRGIFFVTGLSANSVLMEKPIVKHLTEKVRHDYELFGHSVREFGEFTYKAGSWTYYQRVVVKVEMTEKGGQPNIRFIVSNIRNVEARPLYETTYCQRGKDELYIRQFKEGVKGERLSCHTFNANRMRIFLHGMAYNLMLSLRDRALKDTALEKATLLTIRERILLTCLLSASASCSLPFPSRCSRRRWSLSIPSIIQCTRNSPMH